MAAHIIPVYLPGFVPGASNWFFADARSIEPASSTERTCAAGIPRVLCEDRHAGRGPCDLCGDEAEGGK